jgi:hypothetical protein
MQPVRAELVRVEYPPGNDAPADPNAFRRRGRVVAAKDGEPLPSGSTVSMVDGTLDLAAETVPRGTTLRYGVRVRDRRGRPSPLVVAPDLVPVSPPAPPSSLQATATAEGIRLRWKGPDPTGTPGRTESVRFNLYRSTPEGEYGGKPIHPLPLTVPEFLDTAVETGGTYLYMVRTAVSESAPFIESTSTSQVRVVAEDRFPPAPPSGLVAVQEGTGIRLFWDPNQERDLSGYRVYRRKAGGDWTLLPPDPVTQPLFLDSRVAIDDRLTYRVTAVDRSEPPNESSPSGEARVTVAVDPEGSDPGGR